MCLQWWDKGEFRVSQGNQNKREFWNQAIADSPVYSHVATASTEGWVYQLWHTNKRELERYIFLSSLQCCLSCLCSRHFPG